MEGQGITPVNQCPSKWGPRDPVSGGRGPRKNWILYKFDRKLAVGGPRKDGRGPRATKTY